MMEHKETLKHQCLAWQNQAKTGMSSMLLRLRKALVYKRYGKVRVSLGFAIDLYTVNISKCM